MPMIRSVGFLATTVIAPAKNNADNFIGSNHLLFLSKTGWVYILDRITGKPLVGIDEKPVAQDPRQLTSPTQPFPRGDAFVPHEIDIAPEDFPLVNQGPYFHTLLDRGSGRQAVPTRRGQLASQFLRSRQQLLLCVRQRQPQHLQRRRRESGNATRRRALPGRRVWRLAHSGHWHIRRAGYEDQPSGMAAGVEGFLLQRLDDYCRRLGFRRPERRASHGSGLLER